MNWTVKDDPRLPEHIRQRFLVSDETAQRNGSAINDSIGPKRQEAFMRRLKHIANSTEPVWIRLRQLYALVDEHMSFVKDHSGCRKGCCHCCHVAVAMLRPEAEMLGMRIKRKPKPLKGLRTFEDFDFGYHNPCPFLKDHQSSIYEDRPLACRMLWNLDEDGTLCELYPPLTHPVPYLNTTAYHVAYVQICQSIHSGDIRDYFPSPETD